MVKNYIKGDSIPNATSYELYEKESSNYNLLKTDTEINFNLEDLSLGEGTHTLVVKAKADGYEDSDYSNEVTYTIEAKAQDPVDLQELSLKHINVNSSTGDNLSYDIYSNELSINSSGWYKSSYLNLPLKIGSSIEFTVLESSAMGIFIGIYSESEVLNPTKNNIDYWASTNTFGLYIPHSTSEDILYAWDTKKTTLDNLKDDTTSEHKFKYVLTSSGVKAYIDDTLIDYTAPASGLNTNTNYYAVFRANGNQSTRVFKILAIIQ